jgi:hypothetical protein
MTSAPPTWTRHPYGYTSPAPDGGRYLWIRPTSRARFVCGWTLAHQTADQTRRYPNPGHRDTQRTWITGADTRKDLIRRAAAKGHSFA